MTKNSEQAMDQLFALAMEVRNGELSIDEAQDRARKLAAQTANEVDRVMFESFANDREDNHTKKGDL